MSKASRRRFERRDQQLKLKHAIGMRLLKELRDDQVPRVRQIIKSWTGVSLTEIDIHVPQVQLAIRHVLNHHP